MDILTAISSILTGGLNVQALFTLFLTMLAFFVVFSIQQYLRRLAARRWVLKNQQLGVDSTWCRIPTPVGHIDGVLRTITTRSLTFELWEPNRGFIGIHEIPILTFVGQARTILTTRPEDAPDLPPVGM